MRDNLMALPMLPGFAGHALAMHGLAALAGLGFMAVVFFGYASLVPSGAMFVAPVLVLVGAHCLLLGFAGHNPAQAALSALRNTVVTAALLLLGACFALLLLPQHAGADAGFSAGAAGGVVFCLIILFLVLFGLAGVAYIAFLALRGLFRLIWPKPPKGDRPDGHINEGASFAIVLAALAAFSLEGLPHGPDFDRTGRASASLFVAAPTAAVWSAVGKASSPALAMPFWLMPFPHLVAISDEGAELGSRRVAHLLGREGEGDLTLQVSARGPHSVTWVVEADTTPLALWAAGQDITYQIAPVQGGTLLTVSCHYRRLLAPAVVFGPYMRLVLTSAMQLLARDKRDRAEALALNPRG